MKLGRGWVGGPRGFEREMPGGYHHILHICMKPLRINLKH